MRVGMARSTSNAPPPTRRRGRRTGRQGVLRGRSRSGANRNKETITVSLFDALRRLGRRQCRFIEEAITRIFRRCGLIEEAVTGILRLAPLGLVKETISPRFIAFRIVEFMSRRIRELSKEVAELKQALSDTRTS